MDHDELFSIKHKLCSARFVLDKLFDEAIPEEDAGTAPEGKLRYQAAHLHFYLDIISDYLHQIDASLDAALKEV